MDEALPGTDDSGISSITDDTAKDPDVPGADDSADEDAFADVPTLYNNFPLRAATTEVSTVEELKNAFASAADGSTIQLAADFADTSRLSGVTVDKNITLDLNGHTLYVTGNQASNSIACAITQKTGKLTVTSSNGRGKVDCDKGGFILQEHVSLISNRQDHENNVKPLYANQLELEMSNVDISCGNTTNVMLYLRPQSITNLTNCTFVGSKEAQSSTSRPSSAVFFIQQGYPFKDRKTTLTVNSCKFENNFPGVVLSPGCDYDVDI